VFKLNKRAKVREKFKSISVYSKVLSFEKIIFTSFFS
jgi:hypothetical protein